MMSHLQIIVFYKSCRYDVIFTDNSRSARPKINLLTELLVHTVFITFHIYFILLNIERSLSF